MFVEGILTTAALLLSVIPHDSVTVDRVCDVETNAFHDGDGRLVFTQVIWRCWNPRKSRFDIVDWRLLRPGMQPVYDYERREYRCHWFDGERERLVIAKTARESFSQHDPELTEREIVPTDKRRLLSK